MFKFLTGKTPSQVRAQNQKKATSNSQPSGRPDPRLAKFEKAQSRFPRKQKCKSKISIN